MATYIWNGPVNANANYTTNTNWLLNGAVPTTAPASGDDVQFNGIPTTAQNVNFNGANVPLSITYGGSGTVPWFLGGSARITGSTTPLSLPSGFSISVGTAGSILSLSLDVQNGSGTSITKNGPGILAFTSGDSTVSNTYTFTGGLTVNNGGILWGSGTGTTVSSIGTGTITLAGSGAYLDRISGYSSTLTNNIHISASGASLRSSLGTFFQGTITASSGISYSLAGGAGTLAVSGTMVLSNNTVTLQGSVTIGSGLLSGSGVLISDSGTGETFNLGTTSFTGIIKPKSGTIRFNGNASSSIVDWGTAGSTAIYAGAYAIGALNTDSGTANDIAFNGSLGWLNTNEVFNGAITGTGTLTKEGTGSFTLTKLSTRTGTTNVNEGELIVKANALGTGTLTVANNGILTFDATAGSITTSSVPINLYNKLKSIGGNVTHTGAVTIRSTQLTIENATVNTLFNAATASFTLPSLGAVTDPVVRIIGPGNVYIASDSSSGYYLNSYTMDGTGLLEIPTSGVEKATIINSGNVRFRRVGGGGYLHVAAGSYFCAGGASNSDILLTTTTYNPSGSTSPLTGEGTIFTDYTSGSQLTCYNTTVVFGGTIGSETYSANSSNFTMRVYNNGNLVLTGNKVHTHNQSTTLEIGTLDVAGEFKSSTILMKNASGILGAGAWDGTSGGRGDFKIPAISLDPTTPPNSYTLQSSKLLSGTPSKIYVTGSVSTATTNGSIKLTGKGPGWVPGQRYTVLKYDGVVTGAASIQMGVWQDSLVPRVGSANGVVGHDTVTKTLWMEPGVSNSSATWNGGIGGTWYHAMLSGWSGLGAPAFFNNDIVQFDSTNTDPANVTSSVSVNGLTMNSSTHRIYGAAISNTNTLTIGDAKQTIENAVTTSGLIYILANGELEVSNSSVLNGTQQIAMQYMGASLTSNVTLTTARSLGLLNTAGTNNITKTSGTTLTISGSLTGSTTNNISTVCNVRGHGTLAFTGSISNIYNRFVIADPSTLPGQNVLSFTATLPSNTAITFGAGGIFQTASTTTINKSYGLSGIMTDSLGGGGGFSCLASISSTLTINMSITFTQYSANSGTQWYGPLYFGNAFGTRSCRIKMTGTTWLFSSVNQVFHVYSGVNSSDNSSVAELATYITGTGSLVKRGPGILVLSGSVNDFSGAVQIDAGRLVIYNRAAVNNNPITMANGTVLVGSSTTGICMQIGTFTPGVGCRVVLGSII